MTGFRILLFLFLLAFGFGAWAQKSKAQAPAAAPQKGTPVELIHADALEGGIFKGEDIRKLIGNVELKQENTHLFCDSAYQYKDRNVIEAFSNVRINQADTVTITGQRLFYDGDLKKARITGGVVLQDQKMTLTTPSLDYSLNDKMAYYTEGGTIVDAENTLTSKSGSYSTAAKFFAFKSEVQLTTKDAQINCDTLHYSSLTKIAYFMGDTKIVGQNGTITAKRGQYDTVRKFSLFSNQAQVETPEYLLKGDFLYYDEKKGYGKATDHVTFLTKKDSVVLTGQNGQYWKTEGRAKVFGQAVMRRPTDRNDTLFLAADTLVSFDRPDSDTLGDLALAYPHVRIYKGDLQGRCDSLSYNLSDSLIRLFTDPILWSSENQLTAKHIKLKLRDKEMYRMYMERDAFVVSTDTIKNYNQVAGRNMTAYFKDNQMRRVDVNGNAESIYHALEGDTALTGMNRAVCANMVIRVDSNRLQTITFLQQPEARFVPPHEIKEDDRKLPGFSWRIKERPLKEDVFKDEKALPRPAREVIAVDSSALKAVAPVGKKSVGKDGKGNKSKKGSKQEKQPADKKPKKKR